MQPPGGPADDASAKLLKERSDVRSARHAAKAAKHAASQAIQQAELLEANLLETQRAISQAQRAVPRTPWEKEMEFFCLNGRESRQARAQQTKLEAVLAARGERLYGDVGQTEKHELLQRMEEAERDMREAIASEQRERELWKKRPALRDDRHVLVQELQARRQRLREIDYKESQMRHDDFLAGIQKIRTELPPLPPGALSEKLSKVTKDRVGRHESLPVERLPPRLAAAARELRPAWLATSGPLASSSIPSQSTCKRQMKESSSVPSLPYVTRQRRAPVAGRAAKMKSCSALPGGPAQASG